MSRFRRIIAVQLARVPFALAGAVLLSLVAWTSSAQAGCGDYVFIRNASGQLIRASSLMKGHVCTGPHCPDYDPQLAESGATQELPEENLPVKVPCQGPNCSGSSQLPAVPVPPPAPQRNAQESTALLLRSLSNDSGDDSRFGFAPSDSGHELHYPQSIFHPPR